MSDEPAPTKSRSAVVLLGVSVLSGVILLLGMTFIPAATWLWIAYAAMCVGAVLALILGVTGWPDPRAKRATLIAALVLVFAVVLFLYSGVTSETTVPS